MRKVKLKEVVEYSSKRISYRDLVIETYISTDNLLPNKQGVTRIGQLPASITNTPKYESGNILVSNIRPYLKKILYARNEGGASTDVLTFKVKDGFDSKFVYYNLFQDIFFEHMMAGSKGTKMPRGDKNRILDFEIPEFDYLIQKKIAAVLSALDDKIELNNKINIELEQIAKTLYDYWFVQFDFPNTKGKPYKSSGGKMVYNEVLKRDVPQGWEVGNILNISDLLGGGTPSKKKEEYWNGKIPFFTPSDATRSVFSLTTLEHITLRGLEASSTKIFPKGTIFMTARGSVGNIMIASQEMAMNQSCYALKSHSDDYVFLYLTTISMVGYLKAKSSGSIFNSIVSNDIKHTPVLIPNKSIRNDFEKEARPLFEKILSSLQQNQQLAALRDWLLPMLMNGQAKVTGSHAQKDYTIPIASKPEMDDKKTDSSEWQEQRFNLWLENQRLVARGEVDTTTLRAIFDAMDDDDK